MNPLVRLLAGSALCALVLSGCGQNERARSSQPTPSVTDATTSATPSDPTPSTTTPSTTTPSTTTPSNGGMVASVSLRRSGGLKPVEVHRTFGYQSPPPKGFTLADVRRVLRTAKTFVESGDEPAPMPANTCCDRYIYRVTITLTDGTALTYSAIDVNQQPPTFRALLDALA